MDSQNHSSAMRDAITVDFKRAMHFYLQRNYAKALEITEELLLVHGKSKSSAILLWLQGTIFSDLADITENFYVKYVYLLGAEESGYQVDNLSKNSLEYIHFHASSLFRLGELTKSKGYYEQVVTEGEEGLSLENPEDISEYNRDLHLGSLKNLFYEGRVEFLRQDLERLINIAEVRLKSKDASDSINESSINHENESDSRLTRALLRRAKMNKNEIQKALVERLRSFWERMSVNSKRDFMKVNIEKLKVYTEGLYDSEGAEALEKVLGCARTKRKWKLWSCGACPEEFHCSTECTKHLEQNHFRNVGHSLKDILPQKLSETWDQMVYAGDWEPVNIAAAVEMIKHRPEEVKKFVYVNGWSKDWPLTNDALRRECLKEIRDILKLLVERNFLYNGARNWFLFYLDGLPMPHVTEQDLDDCGLLKTPQIICFLELCHLEGLHWFLNHLDMDKETDKVVKAVDIFSHHYRVNETLYFSNDFSCLLLDERLLRGEIDAFEDDGTVQFVAADAHYAQVLPQGDEIISWLFNGCITNKEFEFRKPTRIYNLDFWLAVSRILESRNRVLERTLVESNYIDDYDATLMQAEKLCIEEDERRTKYPDDQWQTYASVLCKRCSEVVGKDGADLSNNAKLLLTVIRDVLEGASCPSVGEFRCEDYPNWLSKLDDVEDDFVIGSFQVLRKLKLRQALVSSKTLVLKNSTTQHLNGLIRLSVYDTRSCILPLLKSFLRMTLEGMEVMDAKARSDAAEALLLLEIQQEKEKKSELPKKKKKARKNCRKTMSNKEPSTSLSVPLDQEAGKSESSVANKANPLNNSEDAAELMKREEEEYVERVDKATFDAIDALLSLDIQQEEKTKSGIPKKKKKNKKNRKPRANKEASTGMPVPLDQEAGKFESSVANESSQLNESGYVAELIEKEEKEYQEHGDEARKPEEQMNCIRGAHNESQTINVTTEDQMDTEEEASDQDESGQLKCEKPSSNTGYQNEAAREQHDFTWNEIEPVPRGTSSEDKATSDLKDDFQHIGVDSSALLGSATGEDANQYESALDMIMKALWHIRIFKDELERCLAPTHVHVEDPCAICSLRDLFNAFSSEQTDPQEGLYPYLLNSLRIALKDTHPQAQGSAELLTAIFEFLHSWKTRYNESIINSIFLLEEFERMVCYRCRREPNYPEQWSYGIIVSANSLRQIKFVLDGIKFEKLLKLILMNHQMICDPKTGGCGERNYVRHVLTRCPPILTVALEWGENETEKEISATVMALATEVDISELYEVEKSRAKYRLVLMVGRAETEHYCIAKENKNEKWIRHSPSTTEGIGDWKSVVGFCEERKVRPEILFFESKLEDSKRAARSASKRRRV